MLSKSRPAKNSIILGEIDEAILQQVDHHLCAGVGLGVGQKMLVHVIVALEKHPTPPLVPSLSRPPIFSRYHLKQLRFGSRYELGNHCKIILDALTGIVWRDATQIERMTVAKAYDKLRPGVEIEITV